MQRLGRLEPPEWLEEALHGLNGEPLTKVVKPTETKAIIDEEEHLKVRTNRLTPPAQSDAAYANSAASTPTLATAFTTKGALLKLLLPPHRRVGVQVSVV